MVSFLGMIMGTMMASFLARVVPAWGLSLTFIAISLGGVISSQSIRAQETPPEEDSRTIRPVLFLLQSIRQAKNYKGLNSVVVALSVFWFIAGLIQMTLLVYCRRDLGMSDFSTGLVLTSAAVGTGAGCFLSGSISGKIDSKILVPSCGLAITLLFFSLYAFRIGGFYFGLLFFITGFLCGLYKVPFDAAIIRKVPGRNLGHMLGYSNQLSFLFILAASAAFALITRFTEMRVMFLFLGAVMGLTTLFIVFSKYLWSTKQE